MAAEELSQDDIMALADAFPPGPPSVALLTMAGYPRYAIPGNRDLNALEFWSAVADQIASGVMDDARTSLFGAARRKYPHNPKFSAAVLRVLVIGASPLDVPPVRADQESRAIEEAALPGRVEVRYAPAAQATDLEKVRSFQPDIVHFVCHGEDDSLIFNDVLGESAPVKAELIARTLRFYRDRGGVRLRGIVLAACDGDTIAPAFSGAADTVIGHRGKLPDPCGVAFAARLYRLLNDTADLAAAAAEAAQLTAQFAAECAPVIDNLIVLRESG